MSDLIEVRLVGIPIDLWRRASSQQEALRREFEIIRARQSAESIPNRLIEVMDRYNADFGDEPTWDQLRQAEDRGEATKDLTFKIPRAAAVAARELGKLMAEVDAYCLQGDHLLTVATPPELVALREWMLTEIINQIETGNQPTSWELYLVAPTRVDADRIVFRGALDLATAGLLRDAIQDRRSRGVRQLVVDLSSVGFVDSIGIGLLVTTHNRLDEDGATMRLIAPRRLQELLRLSGLTDLLKPEDPPRAATA